MSDKVARVAFVADVASFVKGVDKAQKKTQGFQATLSKMAMPAALAFGAVTAAAVDFTRAAADDQKAAAVLAGTLKNTTGATAAQTAAVESWITKTSMAAAVADDDLRPALGQLATVTGDVAEAQDLMAAALDISAQTGKPLAVVTAALAKAHEGNLAALNKVIPGMVDASKKGQTFESVLRKLKTTTKGAAETAANNDPYKKMSIALQETKEAIGAGLLPVLAKLAPVMANMAAWAQDNAGAISALMLVIGGLSGAVMVVNGALKVYRAIQTAMKAATIIWTGVQWALNAAMAANPIGLVVLAVAALIAMFVLAYTKVDWFRKGVDTALGFIKNIFVNVMGWITEKVPAGFEAVLGFIRGIPDTLTGIGKTIFNALTWPYRTAFNFIIDAWNNTLGKINFDLPGILGGAHIAFPTFSHIPALANGGIVTSPTLALIGENGPEAVVPLGRRGAPGGITINVSGALDPVAVARQISRLLAQSGQRLGTA